MKDEELLVHGGRPSHGEGRQVNWPPQFGSTMVFDTLAAFESARDRRYENGSLYYGRYGNEASFSLERALAGLDRAHGVTLTSSGVSAISAALLTFARPGTTLLLADNLYGNTRAFCLGQLQALGVRPVIFDPMRGIDGLIDDTTCAVMFEAPGSGTFEVCDIRAIAAAAQAKDVPTIFDNTWASPLFCRPLELGVDVSVYSGSKHLCGHSDAMLGVIASTESYHQRIRKTVMGYGDKPGAQEVFLALRGLRTLKMRMQHQDRSGRLVAEFLATQPQVARVLHPALETCPGHDNWRRDFTGSAALFSVVFHTSDETRIARFVEGLNCFGIGVSWGGYESLVLPMKPDRTAGHSTGTGSIVRFSIGFDDHESLLADLAQALPILTD